MSPCIPPKDARTRKLPTSELRPFLNRLFTEEFIRIHASCASVDATTAVAGAARDVAELPAELLETLSEALDLNSDGLIEEEQLCALWLWLFGSDSRLTRLGSIARLAHEAPSSGTKRGRLYSTSL